jgi:hypothetical protein
MTINKGLAVAAVFASGMIGSSLTSAASLTYILDINNVFTPSGDSDFVYVTVADGTGDHAGDIKFTVDANESLFDTNPVTDSNGTYLFENFGIQSFGFNIDVESGLNFGSLAIEYPVGSTPSYDSWSTSTDKNQDGFGQFDMVVSDNGFSRQDPLMFWISGVDGDTIDTYSLASQSGDNGATNYWFTAHVTDFNTGEYGWRTTTDGENCSEGEANCIYQLLTSAYFTGGDGFGGPPAGVIPVPAAVWLFGSGLLGLVGVARRRKVS